jgi:ClpP class serine protease
VASTQKSYRNIQKLLQLVGVRHEELGCQHDSSRLWNQFVEKSQREKEFTHKWLDVVEEGMLQSVHHRRNIPKENLSAIRSQVLHPAEALRLKLIDAICTFEQFKGTNFPNCEVEEHVYRI